MLLRVRARSQATSVTLAEAELKRQEVSDSARGSGIGAHDRPECGAGDCAARIVYSGGSGGAYERPLRGAVALLKLTRPLCGGGSGIGCAAGAPADRKARRRLFANSNPGIHVGHGHNSRINE